MKREYIKPELELTMIRFERLLDTVGDSRPEGSGWDTDDKREE